MNQEELFEIFMKASNGQKAGTIKGAAVNCILFVLLSNSSSVDEAIIQWNELSNFMERELHGRFHAKALSDEISELESKLNGDTFRRN